MKTRGGRGRIAPHQFGLTLRVGVVFVALILVVFMTGQFREVLERNGSHLPWVVLLVALGFGGLVTLRAGRVPGQIENELLRAGGDPANWREIRPMMGSGSALEAWNALLEQLDQRLEERRNAFPGSGGVAAGEPVVDAQTALMARAMRSVSAAIAVTDSQFVVLSGNGPLAALFHCRDAKELQRRNLVDALASLACGDEPENLAALDRLRGGGHAVSVRLQTRVNSDDSTETPQLAEDALQDVSLASKPTEQEASRMLRVVRTRLSGREGDSPGYAWLVQDITQQTLAAKARDEFLHTATHELRTPLANLRAYAEALSIEDGVSVEEQKEFCNIIMDETNRLSRLVDHLLTVGQMEAGSMVVRTHRLDTKRIIEEVIDNIRPQINTAGLELETGISPKLRIIRGDKEKLQACLVNLIGNAVKYTPRGGRVRVNATQVGDWLEVSVEDTGIGIAPEDQPRVFEKFYRVESDAVREQTGNGLGLAFAREVARLHQGEITLKSALGEGSVFTLRLPAPDEPETL